MSVILKQDEYLWNPQGLHVHDERGYATRCSEDTEVTFDSLEIEEEALSFIRADREFRGCDPDTGLPLPEPAPLVSDKED